MDTAAISGTLEGFMWLVVMVGFLGLAGVLAIVGAVMGFVFKNKFWVILIAIVSWVGYKLVKNSKQGKNILDSEAAKSVKKGLDKIKPITEYLK